VQVNRAYHQGRAFAAGAAQDVWSVAVIALELLSATPITHQTGAIPGYAHQALAQHFEVLASWYHNLWGEGLGRAGVSAEDALTRELLHVLQECFAADASQRPITQALYSKLRELQRKDEDEARSGASQVCATGSCPAPG
jgi:hypothetical protein